MGMSESATQTHIADEFRERLDMLEESEQVTNLARRLTEMSVAQLSDELQLTLTEDNAAPFVTHLAIALTRINRGDPVNRVMRDCSRLLQREISTSEISYMTVHLCVMVDLQSETGS